MLMFDEFRDTMSRMAYGCGYDCGYVYVNGGWLLQLLEPVEVVSSD